MSKQKSKSVSELRTDASKADDQLIPNLLEALTMLRKPDSGYQQAKAGVADMARQGSDGYVGGAAPYSDAEIRQNELLKGRVGGAIPYTDAQIAENESTDRGVPFVGGQGGAPLFGQVMPKKPDAAEPMPMTPDQGPPMAPPALEGVPPMLDKNLGLPPGGGDVAALLAAGGGAKAGKKSGGKVAAEGHKASAAGAEAASPAASPMDAITKMLGLKQSQAESDRDAANNGAEHARDYSDTEKLFMALISILPAAVGGGLGGLVGGGVGAATGVAGGLQGSAQAAGMISGAKEKNRQELLGLAEKAQGRVDQAGNQLLGHEEKLGDQAFHTSERKAGEVFAGGEGDKNRRNAQRLAILGDTHAMEMKKLDIAGELEKARISAGAKGGEQVKDFEGRAATFAAAMADASDSIDRYSASALGKPSQGLIATSTFANLLKNPDTQKFAVAVNKWASAAGHNVSGKTISEEEWNLIKAEYIPVYTDDPSTIEEKKMNRLKTAYNTFLEAGPAKGRVQDALDKFPPGGGAAVHAPAPIPPDVHSAGLEWLQANPDAPQAQAIRDRLGAQ